MAHPFMDEAFFEKERYNIPHLYLPNADTWVAELDGIVVGFIALIGNEVGGLFLDPSSHGRGVGKAMMDKAQELHGDLVVEVFKENAIGRRFYEQYGFKLLHEKVENALSYDGLWLEYRCCCQLANIPKPNR